MTTSVTRKKLPLRCPACDAPLRVSKMICGRCATEVSGEFELSEPQTEKFILLMLPEIPLYQRATRLYTRSLKDMAKKMGVSYPTVRNYLDDLIEKLNNMEENER